MLSFLPPWVSLVPPRLLNTKPRKLVLPASLVPPRKSKTLRFLPPWCLPGASQAVQISPFYLPGASLVLPWCLPGCPNGPCPPASLVSPWCLPGCPNGPFLPPWCLPGASQAVQLDRIPILDGRRILSKFEYNFNGERPGSRQILGWAPRPAARSTGWPLKGRSEHRIALNSSLVAQDCL